MVFRCLRQKQTHYCRIYKGGELRGESEHTMAKILHEFLKYKKEGRQVGLDKQHATEKLAERVANTPPGKSSLADILRKRIKPANHWQHFVSSSSRQAEPASTEVSRAVRHNTASATSHSFGASNFSGYEPREGGSR